MVSYFMSRQSEGKLNNVATIQQFPSDYIREILLIKIYNIDKFIALYARQQRVITSSDYTVFHGLINVSPLPPRM
jgi:hypothetical protein